MKVSFEVKEEIIMINNKVEAIKEHIEAVMKLLEIPVTESNRNTPLRVAKMWCNELFENRNNAHLEELNARMKVFPNVYDSEMVITKDIPFNSTCEHHWLPFSGTVSVGYVPTKSVIGLSKIPRVVRYFSRKPQLQEQLTSEIGEYLFALLEPKALFVEVCAKHQCVMCRGAESDCDTVTYAKFSSPDVPDEEYQQYWNEFKTRM